jgi:hypothetical protein
MFSTAAVLGPGIGSAIYQINREALWISALGVGVFVLIGFELLELRVRTTSTTTTNMIECEDVVV